jgi:hypothetical protein
MRSILYYTYTSEDCTIKAWIRIHIQRITKSIKENGTFYKIELWLTTHQFSLTYYFWCNKLISETEY